MYSSNYYSYDIKKNVLIDLTHWFFIFECGNVTEDSSNIPVHMKKDLTIHYSKEFIIIIYN